MRLSRKKRTKTRRIRTILSVTFAKKRVIMPTNIQKSQKTSGSLVGFHINNKEKGRRIKISVIHLVSSDL